MGAFSGVNPGNEPRADGYLHGQVWNRPASAPGIWIIFRVIHIESLAAITWLDGAVTTPHAPAIYLSPGSSGNIRPFNPLRCDTYTGDPPPADGTQFNFTFRRLLPASGRGAGGSQAVRWRETAPVFLNGTSVVDIGINTSGIKARYLYFDFVGELYKTVLGSDIEVTFDPSSMIPALSPILVYTAADFPDETVVDWAQLTATPAEATPLIYSGQPSWGTWINYDQLPSGEAYNYFSVGGSLFAIDTDNLSDSRLVYQLLDADTTIIPNREPYRQGGGWFGGYSSLGVPAYHWDADTNQYLPTT